MALLSVMGTGVAYYYTQPQRLVPMVEFKIDPTQTLDNTQRANIKAGFEAQTAKLGQSQPEDWQEPDNEVAPDTDDESAQAAESTTPQPEEAREPVIIANSVVITGLGLNAELTENIIKKMPTDVALAFSPYAANLAKFLELAKASGHETYIEIPQNARTGNTDSGPLGIVPDIEIEEKNKRLRYINSFKPNFKGYLTMVPDMWVSDQAERNALLYLTQPTHVVNDNLTEELIGQVFASIRDPKKSSLVFVAAKPMLVNYVGNWVMNTKVVAPSRQMR
jgi:hypothetical protein